MNLDPKVRFVSIIDSQGQVVYGGQRQGIENYLSELDQCECVGGWYVFVCECMYVYVSVCTCMCV